MKQLKKSLLTLVAFMAMTTGARAQDPTITVYFTDAKNWGDVKVHYWPNGTTWPGNAMTYVEDNEYNQKVYKAQVPANVEGIIFNGNGKQTVDITENIANNAWWYSDAEGGDGKFTVGYVGKYLAVEPTQNPNEWTFEMPAYGVELGVEYYPEATITTASAAAADVIAGTAAALVSGGVADGGTIYYALGTDDVTAPTDGWTSTVPTAESFTETGTAYVWYMVVGDDEHSDSEVIGCVAVPVTAVSYYVVGTMTDPTWAINTAYQLLPNTENAGEYYIHNVTLTAGTEL